MIRQRPPPSRSDTPSNDAASEEARAWVARLASGDITAETDGAFRAWLNASAHNRSAFVQANGLWDNLVDVDAVETLLATRGDVLSARRVSLSRRAFTGAAAAALLASAAAVGLMAVMPAPVDTILIETGTSQIETFTLSDGSMVTLGGASRVSGRMTDAARELELVAGNAFFDIARDETRPLTVTAGGYAVHVLGTRFDVKMQPDWVSVAVDHGHVEVTALGQEKRQALMAGDKIIVSAASGFGPVRTFDADQEFSWRSGRLSFVDASLRDIITGMNQYSARPLTLARDAPADLRLTLSFRTDQIDQVLTGLESSYPVGVSSTPEGVVISGRADEPR
ncbi:FecR domain-containing protein [Hyphomonas sp. WL0036]|uniref:FecR family protein n=1 Tax=Hyphomonas sediminis TaxID=2866160 RepID=UPI001C7F2C4F|nr:FecR domain-containing protein [Hyphomonas sediminis]MBY9068492.1 FecR domain-containing protein [Hyphomonas sediminis]